MVMPKKLKMTTEGTELDNHKVVRMWNIID